MKHALRTATAASLAVLAALSGCQKPPAPGTPPNPETAKLFDAVGQHLDPGGDIYLYLRTEQILAQAPAKLDEWKSSFETAMGSNLPVPKDQVDSYYAVLRKALVESGFTQLRAYGFSAVELPSGLSRMKSVIYSGALESPGMVWKLSGSKESHTLSTLDFVPADAVYASFADFDLEVLWNYLLDAANGISDPKIKQQLQSVPAISQMVLGMSPKDFFASLGSEWGIVVTADPEKTMQWPSVPKSIDLPLTRAAFLLRVTDDKIYDLIVSRAQAALGQMMPLKQSNEKGVKMTTVDLPGGKMPLTPTIARFGDYLVIATAPQIVEALARTGATPPALMKDTEEFKTLSAGEKLEGNAYAFLSERGTKILRTFQMNSAGDAEMTPAMKGQLERIYDAFSQRSLFSIARMEKDGMTSTMVSPDGSKKFLTALAAIPVAIGAVAMPAILNAQKAAKRASAPSHIPTPAPQPPDSPLPAQAPQPPLPPQTP